jgi:hypothetical protein
MQIATRVDPRAATARSDALVGLRVPEHFRSLHPQTSAQQDQALERQRSSKRGAGVGAPVAPVALCRLDDELRLRS